MRVSVYTAHLKMVFLFLTFAAVTISSFFFVNWHCDFCCLNRKHVFSVFADAWCGEVCNSLKFSLSLSFFIYTHLHPTHSLCLSVSQRGKRERLDPERTDSYRHAAQWSAVWGQADSAEWWVFHTHIYASALSNFTPNAPSEREITNTQSHFKYLLWIILRFLPAFFLFSSTSSALFLLSSLSDSLTLST